MYGIIILSIVLLFCFLFPIFEMLQGIPETGLRTYLEYLAGNLFICGGGILVCIFYILLGI